MRLLWFAPLTLLLCCGCAGLDDSGGPSIPDSLPALDGSAAASPGPARPSAPVPVLSGLPAPSALRSVSWESGDRLAHGALFVENWPHGNVDADWEGWAEYESSWQTSAAPVFADLAYACLLYTSPSPRD